MKKNNNWSFVRTRKQSWINSLFSLFVVAIPALLIWFFFTNDFYKLSYSISWWVKLIIVLSFLVGTFIVTLIFVYVNILNITIFTFTIPVSVSFMVIFATADLKEIWIRALAIIPCFLLIIPTSIVVKKIEMRILVRNNWKNKTNKIIGYKEK